MGYILKYDKRSPLIRPQSLHPSRALAPLDGLVSSAGMRTSVTGSGTSDVSGLSCIAVPSSSVSLALSVGNGTLAENQYMVLVVAFNRREKVLGYCGKTWPEGTYSKIILT